MPEILNQTHAFACLYSTQVNWIDRGPEHDELLMLCISPTLPSMLDQTNAFACLYSTQVKWIDRGPEHDELLVSISTDGRVTQWSIAKVSKGKIL